MMKKFIAILNARNKEFIRDKAALAWNFIFPVLLIFGFSFMFSDDARSLHKVGILTTAQSQASDQSNPFLSLKHIQFVNYQNQEDAIVKVDQHKIDLLVDFEKKQYWVNETSAKGYIVEALLISNFSGFERSQTSGRAIRYVDWVMPGILGMNMMFSCLFGVGYVIVRYRKNGVLKRFQATPLTALEFLTAQVVSRLLIVMAVTSIVFIGCHLLLDFYILGSLLDLFIVGAFGAASMIAMSLLIAAKSASEEFAGGLLNFLSWPMMLLSGVWFSLEGAPEIVKSIAQVFPLTHMLDAARAIMTDGVGLAAVTNHLAVLAVMTMVFLAASSWMFSWGDNRT